MLTQEMQDNIRAIANEIISIPIDSLISRQKWGSVSFAAARQDLDLIYLLSSQIIALPIEILPEPIGAAFKASLAQAKTATDGINNFDIEASGSLPQLRDQYISWAKTYAENLLITTQGWIPFLAYQKGDIQKNIVALTKAVEDGKQIHATALVDANIAKKALEDIVAAAREASAEAGVGVFTSDFRNKAATLELEAKYWLWGTVGLAATTICISIAYSYVFPLDVNASAHTFIQYLASKAIAIIVLFTATVWSGRIYKATKHQAATNAHRALSLKTFQAFVQATKDEQTRNAVLVETTRSIFALNASGYLDGKDAGADNPLKVLEVFKGAEK